MSMARFSAVVAVGLIAAACGSAEEPSTTGSSTIDPPTAETPPAPAEARAQWQDTGFELGSTAAGPYQAGQEGQFAIRLAATGNHHVNQDYPISIQITGPDGVTLPRATLSRAEAAEFGDALARFEVPFTATAGHHELRALVDFAVCTPESCMPDTRTLAIALDVP